MEGAWPRARALPGGLACDSFANKDSRRARSRPQHLPCSVPGVLFDGLRCFGTCALPPSIAPAERHYTLAATERYPDIPPTPPTHTFPQTLPCSPALSPVKIFSPSLIMHGTAPPLLQEELAGMAHRIKAMRQALYGQLVARQLPGDWSFVLKQIGMFSYTGERRASNACMCVCV